MPITKNSLSKVNQNEIAALLNVSLPTIQAWKDTAFDESIGPFPQPVKVGCENIYNYYTCKIWLEKYLLYTKYKDYLTPSNQSLEDSDDWKKRRDRALALREELDLEVAQKLLLPSNEVESLWSDTIFKIRAKLLTIPKRINKLLYDGQKPNEREDIIEREIRIILNILSNQNDDE